MTILDLEQHPELAGLAAELRKGLVVLLTEHGQPLGEVLPAHPTTSSATWLTNLADFRSGLCLRSEGNAVLAMRRQDDP